MEMLLCIFIAFLIKNEHKKRTVFYIYIMYINEIMGLCRILHLITVLFPFASY